MSKITPCLGYCRLRFNFRIRLFKILKAKNVNFPELKDNQKEFQIHQQIAKFLFPSEYKRMLPVNNSQANAASNVTLHVEEITRSLPRNPPSMDKLAM